MSNHLLLENDQFIININDTLSEYKRQILTFLYMPIIGQKAANLYLTFFSFVKAGENESVLYTHHQLFKILQFKKVNDFIKERVALEAIGLLKTYYYQSKVNPTGIYYYLLKDVLNPYDFLNDPALSQLLRHKVGEETMRKTASDFLIRRHDINKFTNITKSFDEVYDIRLENEPSAYQSWWVDTKNTGIKVKNKAFNFELLMILLSALDVVDIEAIKNKDFYDLINRYGFFYQLTPEEMKNAILLSIDSNRKINYEKLKMAVIHHYDSKNIKIVVEPKITTPPTPKNEIIQYLETLSPTDIVQNQYGLKLSGVEIKIFDDLMANTKVSLGIINTLLIYVLKEKNGEIPSYNYLVRILNGWLRSGVKNTEDALAKINKTDVKTKASTRKEKLVPGWYDDYIKEASLKTKQEKTSPRDTSLEELEAFFNVRKENNK